MWVVVFFGIPKIPRRTNVLSLISLVWRGSYGVKVEDIWLMDLMGEQTTKSVDG